MLRGDVAVGVGVAERTRAVLRPAGRAAPDLADQAVIAIENVRLFKELGARNVAPPSRSSSKRRRRRSCG
jgi:hypothetical protein